MMNKFILFAITLFGMASLAQQAEAQSKFYVVKDGKVAYSCEGVPDYITFSESELPQQNVPVGGTVGQMVDLGLSVKWADHNVGATNAEDYGEYVAWGETAPKETYNWATYKWCNGSYDSQTKYCTSADYGTVDGKTVLAPEDDAATANWGSDWRTPTDAEWQELHEKCTWEWAPQNGVNGYKVTATNGNYIFLPAAGYFYDYGHLDAGSLGHYWSASLNSSAPYNAWIYFHSGYPDRYYSNRSCGQSVRPVSAVSSAE